VNLGQECARLLERVKKSGNRPRFLCWGAQKKIRVVVKMYSLKLKPSWTMKIGEKGKRNSCVSREREGEREQRYHSNGNQVKRRIISKTWQG